MTLGTDSGKLVSVTPDSGLDSNTGKIETSGSDTDLDAKFDERIQRNWICHAL